VIENHKNLFSVNTILKNLTQNLELESKMLHNTFSKLESTISADREKALQLRNHVFFLDSLLSGQNFYNSISLEMSKIFSILNSCKDHILIGTAVSHETLQHHIRLLRHNLKSLNLEPSMNEDDIDDYYHSKLINCNVYPNESFHFLEIEVKIPVTKSNSYYHSFEIIPVPFVNQDNEICEIVTRNKILIHDLFNENVYTINDQNLKFCDQSTPFCAIPNTRVASQDDLCIINTFSSHTFKNFDLNSCELNCFKITNTKPKVSQLDSNKFSFANFHSLMTIDVVSKKTKVINVKNNHPGSIILDIPCNFELVHINAQKESETLISSSIPCLKSLNPKIELTYSLPSALVNFSSFNSTVFYLSKSYTPFEQINLSYKSFNWSSSLKNLTKLKTVEELAQELQNISMKIPELNSDSTFSLIHIFILLWLFFISLLCIVFAYAIYKLINNLFESQSKKMEVTREMLKKEREVELERFSLPLPPKPKPIKSPQVYGTIKTIQANIAGASASSSQ